MTEYKDEQGAKEIKDYLEKSLSELGNFSRLKSDYIEGAQIDYELKDRHLVSIRELRCYNSSGGSFDHFFGLYPRLIIIPDHKISSHDSDSFTGERRLTTGLKHRFFNQLRYKKKNQMFSLESDYATLDLILDLERDKRGIVPALSIISPYEQFVDSETNRVKMQEYLGKSDSLNKKIETLEEQRKNIDKQFYEFISNQRLWKDEYKSEGFYPCIF